MNIIEKYRENPDNYYYCAEGGFGKTTSLMFLAKDSIESGCNEIPIYIPLKEINYITPRPDILFEYLKGYFNKNTSADAIRRMITEDTSNRYLFLLDGFNEVYNGPAPAGQTVIDLLCTDVITLVKCENVHVILTSRTTYDIADDLIKYFKIARPSLNANNERGLSNEQIERYLGKTRGTIERSMLRNPMFLTMFKVICEGLPDRVKEIDNRFDLFNQYFSLMMQNHKSKNRFDHADTVRPYLYRAVLPYIALNIERSLMDGNANVVDAGELTGWLNAVMVETPPNSMASVTYENVLECLKQEKMINFSKNVVSFNHDLYRDYFASMGYSYKLNEDPNEAMEILSTLTDWIGHNDSENLVRQTAFLDFADFIFAICKRRYRKRIEDKRIADFYRELSGVYDQLTDAEHAAKIGWDALDAFRQVQKQYNPVAQAHRLSFLYYSLKWDEDRIDETKQVIDEAKSIMDKVDDSGEDKPSYAKFLYAKILSNIGSFYYKKGLIEEKRNNRAEAYYEEARKWHLNACEYRKNNGMDVGMIITSYRTLMSDCYHLNDSISGYRYFKEAEALNNPSEIEVIFNGKKMLDARFVVKAMGCECSILNGEHDKEIEDEITASLPEQIEHVYNSATSPHRKDNLLLEELFEKLVLLESWSMTRCENVHECVRAYIRRIQEELRHN